MPADVHQDDQTLYDPRFLKAGRTLADVPREKIAAALNISLPTLVKVESRKNTALPWFDEGWGDEHLKRASAYLAVLREEGLSIEAADGIAKLTRSRGRDETHRAYEGSFLKAARAALDISQDDLADMAGISRRTVVSVEAGTSEPNPSTMDAIARVLQRRGVFIEGNGNNLYLGVSDDRMVLTSPHPRFPFADRKAATLTEQLDGLFTVSIKYVRLHVELDYARPSIWREILVPETATFHDLHRIIQVAFGWKDVHWYKFDMGLILSTPDYNTERSAGDPTAVDSSNVRLKDFRGGLFQYVYDFGDNWKHTLRVLGYEPNATVPMVVDGQRAGPIENSGSVEGHLRLCDSLKGSKAEQKAIRDRIKKSGFDYGDYDPETFDMAEINRALAKEFKKVPADWNEFVQKYGFV